MRDVALERFTERFCNTFTTCDGPLLSLLRALLDANMQHSQHLSGNRPRISDVPACMLREDAV